MSLFDSKKKKDQKSHILNLVAMCLADGQISTSEAEFVMQIGENRFGLSRKEIEKILKNPSKIKFSRPKDESERFYQLYDLIILMFADGKVTQGEMDFCTTIAIQLGFKASDVNHLVDQIIKGIEKGIQKDKVKSELDDWLKN